MKTLHLSIIVLAAIWINSLVFAQVLQVPEFETAYFKSDHGTYPIPYRIINATLIGTTLDLPAKTLVFKINTTSDGQLTVELPRVIIDSKNGSQDKSYHVTTYNIQSLGFPMEVLPEELSIKDVRVLQINFTRNTSDIEISGTYFVENYPLIPQKLESPLKQFKSGVPAMDVTCSVGYVLTIKAEDGSPACVTQQTASTLVERGYAKEIVSKTTTNAISDMKINPTVNHTICDVSYNPETGYSSPLYYNGTIIHTDYTPVLYMPIDSTGKMCVQYYNSNSQSKVGARVFDANNLTSNANNVIMSSSPDAISAGNTTVVYSVNTGHKAGFYGISFSCVGQAFAVGYDNQSRIVLDDFPWYGQTFYCPLQTYEYKITGLHDIGIYYIKTLTHEQLLYDITNTTVTSVHLTPTSQNVTFLLHVRSFDKPVDFVFDYRDSMIDQSKTNPGFVKSFDVCNWNVANRDLVKSFPVLGLGQISVSDNPVTLKPWSSGTYAFSIIIKGLDDGYYGLNPVVYGRPAGITDDNAGLNYVTYDYPVTIGFGSNMDQSGVCSR